MADITVAKILAWIAAAGSIIIIILTMITPSAKIEYQRLSITEECLVDCELVFRMRSNRSIHIPSNTDFEIAWNGTLRDSGFQRLTNDTFDVIEYDTVTNCYSETYWNGSSVGWVNRTTCNTTKTNFHNVTKWELVWRDFEPAGKTLPANKWQYIKIWGKKYPKLGPNNVEVVMFVRGKPFRMSWWNSSYGYCKDLAITENSGNALADYGVEFQINTSGNGMANAQDMRIVDEACEESGSSVAFGAKVIGADDFNITFKMDLSSSGTDTYSVYYGNITPVVAANTSFGSNKCFWYDDFEDGDISDWTIHVTNDQCAVNDVTVYDGVYSLSCWDRGYITGPSQNIDEPTWLEINLYAEGTTDDETLFTGRNGSTDLYATWNGWQVNNEWSYWNGAVTDTGVGSTAGSWVVFIAQDNATHFRFDFEGGGVGAWDAVDTKAATGNTNALYFQAYTDTRYIDDVCLRKYYEPEPTAVLGNEESAPPVDTCTPGASIWNVDCNDNCSKATDISVAGPINLYGDDGVLIFTNIDVSATAFNNNATNCQVIRSGSTEIIG